MNICITSHDCQPEFMSGDKRVSAILGEEWLKMGHHVFFITFCSSSLMYKKIGSIPQFFLPNNETVNCTANRDYFTSLIRDKHIDVVLHQHVADPAFTHLCADVRRLTGCVMVATLHFAINHNVSVISSSFFIRYKLGWRGIFDLFSFFKFWLYKKKQIERKQSRYYNEVHRNFDQIALLSNSFIPQFKKLIGLKNGKLIAINNPSVKISEPLPVKKNKQILWCGRLEYGAKRTDRIIKIWNNICHSYKDWELIVMGSGDVDYFERLSEKYGVKNIFFTGFCNPNKYYKTGAILCMTSSTEGWGMVLVEAQSHGCVPIAYNSFTSLKDIIADGVNGIIIPAFDEKKYIQKLTELMDNEILREKLAKEGFESVKKFDSRIIADKWIKHFNSISPKNNKKTIL